MKKKVIAKKKQSRKALKQKPSPKKNTLPYLRSTSANFGQKAADWLTKWAGSWAFIIGFLIFLALWMSVNVYAWIGGWDPFPFILLNLVLSTLAALQAPIILMSQNRQSQQDHQKMDYDYLINRKTEREIEKIQKTLNRIENRFLKK